MHNPLAQPTLVTNMRISLAHKNAKVPTYGSAGAACFDLYAADFLETKEPLKLLNGGTTAEFTDSIIVDTGLIVEVPPGYGLFLFSRSSQAKDDVSLANAVGIVDQDYRGAVKLILRRSARYGFIVDGIMESVGYPQAHQGVMDAIERTFVSAKVSIGDRVAQACLLKLPRVDFTVVGSDQLTTTERADGGFGSTGK